MPSLAITTQVEGLPKLENYLQQVSSELKNRTPLMKYLGTILRSQYIRTMRAGVDPDGKKLAPVAAWTRTVGMGSGKSRTTSGLVPLVNTGTMMKAMGTVKADNNMLEFGWTGKQLDKAYRMINGIAGRMLVRSEAIRSRKTKRGYRLGTSGLRTSAGGNQYVRFEYAPGQWATKAVSAGSIAIKPRSRNFFYLGKKQVDEVIKSVDIWIDKRINK